MMVMCSLSFYLVEKEILEVTICYFKTERIV